MDPCPKHGFVHDSCVFFLEPVIPPAKTFLEESDLRTGQSTHRIFVSPGADQSFSGTVQSFQHSWNRIAVWIRPTSNGKHRTFYFGKILADRAMFPKRVPILMFEPGFDVGRCMIHPFEPLFPPFRSPYFRIGRSSIPGEHRRGPSQHVGGQNTAPHVMHIIRITVIGGTNGNDGL